jgi:hypothetical protein
LLAHGRWFSPGTPASSTTETGRHEIAEILLKVALITINQIKSIYFVLQAWVVPVEQSGNIKEHLQFQNYVTLDLVNVALNLVLWKK